MKNIVYGLFNETTNESVKFLNGMLIIIYTWIILQCWISMFNEVYIAQIRMVVLNIINEVAC